MSDCRTTLISCRKGKEVLTATLNAFLRFLEAGWGLSSLWCFRLPCKAKLRLILAVHVSCGSPKDGSGARRGHLTLLHDLHEVEPMPIVLFGLVQKFGRSVLLVSDGSGQVGSFMWSLLRPTGKGNEARRGRVVAFRQVRKAACSS